MFKVIREWLGLDESDDGISGHGHPLGDDGYGHTYGVIDPTIATTRQGIWAIKWSFVILAVTSALQLGIVLLSGSVALLADTIHNIADSVTAIPLWIAFMLARRKPSRTFTYGLGRVEDLAGLLIVLIILFSALVAGYEAIGRLLHPQSIHFLGWVSAAGLIGFIGNEAVAVFRIRTGRRIKSAALIADGYHARADGFTSLAVVLGVFGVWLGYPLADPIIGLLIMTTILAIVWQSSKAVLTRMLDGTEPSVLDEIHLVANQVKGLKEIENVQARWIGHHQHVDVEIKASPTGKVKEIQKVMARFRAELFTQLPALKTASIRLSLPIELETERTHGHHHTPDPFLFKSDLANGRLEIINTEGGERMQLTLERATRGLKAEVLIKRRKRLERLLLFADPKRRKVLQSNTAPAEPHEFNAYLVLVRGRRIRRLRFSMEEPRGQN